MKKRFQESPRPQNCKVIFTVTNTFIVGNNLCLKPLRNRGRDPDLGPYISTVRVRRSESVAFKIVQTFKEKVVY
jgi:hypothetical protein